MFTKTCYMETESDGVHREARCVGCDFAKLKANKKTQALADLREEEIVVVVENLYLGCT